jgi:hypothetical protein
MKINTHSPKREMKEIKHVERGRENITLVKVHCANMEDKRSWGAVEGKLSVPTTKCLSLLLAHF